MIVVLSLLAGGALVWLGWVLREIQHVRDSRRIDREWRDLVSRIDA
jgi:hypothetical protein